MAGPRITPTLLAAAIEGDLVNAIISGTPGGVEAQEASEQRKAVAAQRLPKDGTSGPARAAWEALGFVFGERADGIFINATFPPGWALKPTDHSMWSHLLDDKGRQRAAMFYKGAFYDRSAHISLSRRFAVEKYHGASDGGGKAPMEVIVTDGGKPAKSFGKWEGRDYDRADTLAVEAKAWLVANYPDWENPAAYWD